MPVQEGTKMYKIRYKKVVIIFHISSPAVFSPFIVLPHVYTLYFFISCLTGGSATEKGPTAWYIYSFLICFGSFFFSFICGVS